MDSRIFLGIKYNLIRTKRKSVGLIIDSKNGLVVRAPKKATITLIESFIKKKEKWIIKNLDRYKEEIFISNNYLSNPLISIHGVLFSIQYISYSKMRTKAEITENKINIYYNNSMIFSNEEILNILRKKVKFYSHKILNNLTKEWFLLIKQNHTINNLNEIKVRNYKTSLGYYLK